MAGFSLFLQTFCLYSTVCMAGSINSWFAISLFSFCRILGHLQFPSCNGDRPAAGLVSLQMTKEHNLNAYRLDANVSCINGRVSLDFIITPGVSIYNPSCSRACLNVTDHYL